MILLALVSLSIMRPVEVVVKKAPGSLVNKLLGEWWAGTESGVGQRILNKQTFNKLLNMSKYNDSLLSFLPLHRKFHTAHEFLGINTIMSVGACPAIFYLNTIIL